MPYWLPCDNNTGNPCDIDALIASTVADLWLSALRNCAGDSEPFGGFSAVDTGSKGTDSEDTSSDATVGPTCERKL